MLIFILQRCLFRLDDRVRKIYMKKKNIPNGRNKTTIKKMIVMEILLFFTGLILAPMYHIGPHKSGHRDNL